MPAELSDIARAYLEGLGALDRIRPDADPADRALLLEAAAQAVAEVEERWAAMRAAGELKPFTAAYKAARQAAQCAGRPFLGWAAYEAEGKANSARALARQHVGEPVD